VRVNVDWYLALVSKTRKNKQLIQVRTVIFDSVKSAKVITDTTIIVLTIQATAENATKKWNPWMKLDENTNNALPIVNNKNKIYAVVNDKEKNA